MKCTKITLKNRNELSKTNKKQGAQDRNTSTMWFTTGYHGYSYKLSTTHATTPMEPIIEPQLTVTTLIFPDGTAFNTGSSLERWSKKTPRLTSAKNKTHVTLRRNNIMLDDDYDLSYEISQLLEDEEPPKGLMEDCISETEPSSKALVLDLNDYYVASDIEELLLKSHQNERGEIKHKKRHHNNKQKGENSSAANKKRNKYKKTIRFSFSKPPSPETEQVIWVDVTTNVSLEEISQLENAIRTNNSNNNNTSDLLKNDCSKGHGRTIIINEKVKDSSARRFDNNNNEREGELSSEGLEEDFIVKCRQLALTQKKQ